MIRRFSKENNKTFWHSSSCKIKSWDGRWTFYRRIYNARRGLSIMSSNKITRRRDVSTLQAPLLALLLSLTRLLTTSKPPNIILVINFSIKMSLSKGGLISEMLFCWLLFCGRTSFLVSTHPSKSVSNHCSEHLSFGLNSQDSDLAHFLEGGKTL